MIQLWNPRYTRTLVGALTAALIWVAFSQTWTSDYSEFPEGDAAYFTRMTYDMFSNRRVETEVSTIHSRRVLAPFLAAVGIKLIGVDNSKPIPIPYNRLLKLPPSWNSDQVQTYFRIHIVWQFLNFAAFCIFGALLIHLIPTGFSLALTALMLLHGLLTPSLGILNIFWPQMNDVFALVLLTAGLVSLSRKREWTAMVLFGLGSLAREQVLWLLPVAYLFFKFDPRKAVLAVLPYALICVFPVFPNVTALMDNSAWSSTAGKSSLEAYFMLLSYHLGLLGDYQAQVLPLSLLFNMTVPLLIMFVAGLWRNWRYWVPVGMAVVFNGDRHIAPITLTLWAGIYAHFQDKQFRNAWLEGILGLLLAAKAVLLGFAVNALWLQGEHWFRLLPRELFVRYFRWINISLISAVAIGLAWSFRNLRTTKDEIRDLIDKIFSRFDHVNQLHIEIGVGMAFVVLQACLMVDSLSGVYLPIHDNISWNYPVFIYYFSKLSEGYLPVYNFLTRFGDPFVPVAAQMRFWDPVQTVLGLAIWKLTISPAQAFTVFRYVISLIQLAGVYLFFRRYCPKLWMKLAFIPILLFGTMFFGSYRQDGFLNQFLWLPYISIYLRACVFDGTGTKWSHFILGVLIGLSFQSYFFVITSLFVVAYLLFSFLAGLEFKGLSRKTWKWQIGLVILPLIPAASLNLASFSYSKGWVFPARMSWTPGHYPYYMTRENLNYLANTQQNLVVDSSNAAISGASAYIWDLVHIFVPNANGSFTEHAKTAFGAPSEAMIYLGLIAAAFGFWGIMRSDSKLDWFFLNMLCFFYLLSLGDSAHLFTGLRSVYPLLNFVRNAHCLVMHIQFFFLYFILKGMREIDAFIQKVD